MGIRAKWNILKARERSLAKEMPTASGVFDIQGRKSQPYMPVKIGEKVESIRQVKQTESFKILNQNVLLFRCLFPGVPERGGGGGGAGGRYCPLHFSTIVTKQTLANLEARLSKAG